MRRTNDAYPTPEWATKALLAHISISGNVLECCAGTGDIVIPLRQSQAVVWDNDIDQNLQCRTSFDASSESAWQQFQERAGSPDWIVTNPPFSLAPQIVPLAYQHAGIGIAMLLRLSFLEPVENRGHWLNEHPPHELIVTPRISFTNNGKTDSVTTAWMVWYKQERERRTQRIIVLENPKFAEVRL